MELEVRLVHRLPLWARVNTERRIASSSYLIPRRGILTRHGALKERGAAEPLWRRWYVPWVIAAIAIVGLVVAAVGALEMVTVVPERPAPPATPPIEGLVSES